MYLERIPKEDGIGKRILSLNEHPSHTSLEVSAGDLICAVENYDDWIRAFQEHYNLITNQNADYITDNNIMIRGMWIPKQKPRIGFRVDSSKREFRFSMPKGDEEARDIVYKFLERIMV